MKLPLVVTLTIAWAIMMAAGLLVAFNTTDKWTESCLSEGYSQFECDLMARGQTVVIKRHD